MHHNPIVLFDGVCNLCHKSVQFCLKYESTSKIPLLHFASLQSKTGQKILSENNMPANYLNSVLVIDVDGTIYEKSSGVFYLSKYLRFPFSLLRAFSFLPVSFTDWVYSLIARHRYKVFGRADQCMLPPVEKDMTDRFLD